MSVVTKHLMDPRIAERVWQDIVPELPDWMPPWSVDWVFEGQNYVVGMENVDYYTVIPVPFDGHADDWNVIKPIRDAKDLQHQFDKPKLNELFDVPFKFGLEAQGHIPTIEKMLTEGKSWEEIGETIHWLPKTAEEHYEQYTDSKFKSWPEKTVALICCRVGDAHWNPSPGATEQKCWNCNHSVMATIETVENAKKDDAEIICVLCAVIYSKKSGRKIVKAKDMDRAKQILNDQK